MRRPTVSTLVLATVLDVCCVLAFVTIGRHTHHDGDTLAGIWHTGWPFLAGLVIGLVAASTGGGRRRSGLLASGPGLARPAWAW
jgi:hypothetical protein